MGDNEVRSEWHGDGSLPNEQWLQSHWERQVESYEQAEEAQEEWERSEAGQRAEDFRQRLFDAAGINNEEIDQLLDDLASIQEQTAREARTPGAAVSADTSGLSLRDILEDVPPQLLGPHGWLSPNDTSDAVVSNGGDEAFPTFNVQTTDKYTKIDCRVRSRGRRYHNTDFSELLFWLYYRMTPPDRGVLSIHHYPSLHGRYELDALHVGFEANPHAKVAMDYAFTARQRERIGPIFTRFFVEGRDNNFISSPYDRYRDRVTNLIPVAANEEVTIQFGMRLRAEGTSRLGNAILNFDEDEELPNNEIRDNHILIPQSYWHLNTLR